MKKIIAIATVLTISVFLVPGVAQGVTAEELAAQIATLTAQLAALQAQLTTLTGAPTGVPAACTGITAFTVNMSQGSTGANVKCLQAILNQSAATQVAATGVGSAGNETTYFGPLTKAAVVKYQTANAISPAVGYVGPITRAKLNTVLTGAPVTPPVTPPSGAEGSIIATTVGTPASGVEVFIGTTGVGVLALDVKASGSDVLVNRFDVNFNLRPWLYISGLTITDGTISKSVSVTAANTTEVTVSSDYMIRVEGLGINIPKDTTKTITVKVDGVSNLPAGVTSQAVVITISANAIRGADGAGINQYAPAAALSSIRSFTAKSGDTAALELSAHADNPKARNVVVSDSGTTVGIELLKVNVKAKNKNAILRTVEFVASGTDPASGTISAIYLYDGDTLLSSTSSIVSTASSTFANVNLTIPKDTTKALTIKADISKTTGNYVTGDNVWAILEANATGLAADDATTFAAATVSGSTATSGLGYLYPKSPSLVLNTTSISRSTIATGTITYYGKAAAQIRVNLTAQGGDIYVASSTANDFTATSTIAASTTVIETIVTNAADSDGGNWVVRSGETKWFDLGYQLTRADDGNSSTVGDLGTYVYLTNLKWATTDAGASASYTNQTWGLTDLKTGSVVLEYFR